MNGRRTSASILVVLGAFLLGVWAGPTLQRRNIDDSDSAAMASASAMPRATSATPSGAPSGATALRTSKLSASAEPVLKHVESLLAKGTDPRMASEGFGTAEEFVSVAYASRNTGIPFVVLKHRVLEEKASLQSAIHAVKPELDGGLEATRARAEARSDLARVSG